MRTRRLRPGGWRLRLLPRDRLGYGGARTLAVGRIVPISVSYMFLPDYVECLSRHIPRSPKWDCRSNQGRRPIRGFRRAINREGEAEESRRCLAETHGRRCTSKSTQSFPGAYHCTSNRSCVCSQQAPFLAHITCSIHWWPCHRPKTHEACSTTRCSRSYAIRAAYSYIRSSPCFRSWRSGDAWNDWPRYRVGGVSCYSGGGGQVSVVDQRIAPERP